MALDDAGQALGWDRSVTVLTWSDGQLGYRLEGAGSSLACARRRVAALDGARRIRPEAVRQGRQAASHRFARSLRRSQRFYGICGQTFLS